MMDLSVSYSPAGDYTDLTSTRASRPYLPFLRDQLAAPVIADSARLERASVPAMFFVAAVDSYYRRFEVNHRIDALESAVVTMPGLPQGWNGYNAPPPAHRAVELAIEALQVCRSLLIPPDRAVPSADGGVDLLYTSSRGYGSIEFGNDGEVVAALNLVDAHGDAWDVDWKEVGKALRGLHQAIHGEVD